MNRNQTLHIPGLDRMRNNNYANELFDDDDDIDSDDLSNNNDIENPFSDDPRHKYLPAGTLNSSMNGKSSSSTCHEKRPLKLSLHRNAGYSTTGHISNPKDSELSTFADEASRYLERSEGLDPLKWTSKFTGIDGVTYYKLKAPHAFMYCVVTFLAILAQIRFLEELGVHEYLYAQEMEKHCSTEHVSHGVCLGPSWNLVFDKQLRFPDRNSGLSVLERNADLKIEPDMVFTFQTQSSTPTFLAVVEPLHPHSHAKWSLRINHADGRDVSWSHNPKINWDRRSSGMQSGVYIDRVYDQYSYFYRATHPDEHDENTKNKFPNAQNWEGKLTLVDGSKKDSHLLQGSDNTVLSLIVT